MPMTQPIILAFDTSGPWIATALMRDGDVIAEQHVDMAKGQAERLMPAIEKILSGADVTLRDLTAIGVGIGPGNFTGIRISVSAARGLALALGIPAAGVSTLQALAFDAPGPVLTSVDARQNNLYTQVFHVGAPCGPALSTLEDVILPPMKAEACVIGHRATELARITGGRPRDAAHPLVEAIARLAAARQHNTHLPRPAPLYIRQADAAPSREQGPQIL